MFSQANNRSSAPRPPSEEPTMPALIDLWLMPARLWLDLVAPLKLAPVTADLLPLGKARHISGRPIRHAAHGVALGLDGGEKLRRVFPCELSFSAFRPRRRGLPCSSMLMRGSSCTRYSSR